MMVKKICPPTTLGAGDRRHGFQIRRVEQIPEIRVTAYEIEHAAILDEIDRELQSPTQRVSEIHDFKYADEDSLRIHLKLLAVALRRFL